MTGQLDGPHASSDWDFQVITSRPSIFNNRNFLDHAEVGEPCAFITRRGRLGSALKVTAIFSYGELDIVVIPEEEVRGLRESIGGNAARIEPEIMRKMSDQAAVLAGGYRILKADAEIHDLYRFVSTTAPLPRLSDLQVREIAEGFVCDYVSTIRKIERGELIAAQRWLHLYLVEANLCLLHELQQRRGLPTFPDARRLELVVEEMDLEAISISALLSESALSEATYKSANTLKKLVHALIDCNWRWPLKPGR
jgi:hypothetical protein